MKASSTILIALLCGIICASLVACASTLTLEVSAGSNKNWIAVKAANGGGTTSTIEVLQAGSSSWVQMTYDTTTNAGYWTYNDWSKDSFGLPLSFRFTDTNGNKVVMNNAVNSFPGATQTIDSFAQYSATSTGDVTTPSTGASVTTPSTGASAGADSGSSCSGNTKLMVPLYVYPGAAWDSVIAGAKSVKTVAIINPNSGPGGAPDATYVTYMQKLRDAGVEMVGYVHTTYGARALAEVKADIDVYASQWPLVTGIFLDEASNTADQISYYKSLYDYIMAMPGYNYDIINPGVVPDSGYASVATQIVTFEDYGTNAASISTPSWGSCSNKEKFVAIAHTVSSGSMQSIVDTIVSKQYYGYIYVTDGAGGCCTYNALTSYYASLASYTATH